ncbi:parallel beta-helix domain-containing protein [Pyxidicoccus xibeiensis]|uniref:parallel beta-helix domain-containing protein n=1 Tax=Pyxidicoccus xibeiensis TaxID=2906759 RepID=UPI0020A77A7D|nr:parallel beta-helix domain-containing protein [Pyxidicoccus xibeiensis]MCP3140119.1 right-handed parallel beta-helix repeat-containing protein [Pyxidicoccus xibeiensis]
MRCRSPLSSVPRAVLLTLVGLLALPACSDEEDGPGIPLVPLDAGTTDAGTDAGTTDSGTPDAGPTDGGSSSAWPQSFSCQGKPQQTLTFNSTQVQELQNKVNDLADCTTIQLGAGTFVLDNAITIRSKGITITGAGKGTKGEGTGGTASTVLDFSTAAANSNGIDVVGDLFSVSDLAIWNAKKDGLRVEGSSNVTIRRVRTEWAQENQESNGKYGIYPVKSAFVLIEECEAYNAADAGIYVGQTRRANVIRNIAKQNVAGIEIENTKFAWVQGNTAVDNTTGLVVFDLPGNPIKGTDILVVGNTITGNNRPNFASVTASSSTVSQVPAGTGTFILASRRVEFVGNTWGDNNTVDIAVLSGLAIEPDITQWSAAYFNFPSADVYIHGNTFTGGSGDAVDNGNLDPERRPLGVLVGAVYQYGASQGEPRVEHVFWDGIDPAPRDESLRNPVNLCFTDNKLPTAEGEPKHAIVDFDLQAVSGYLRTTTPNLPAAWAETRRYPAGAAPFNCSGFLPKLALP